MSAPQQNPRGGDPGSPARALGGLLGVLLADLASPHDEPTAPEAAPITRALLHTAHRYLDRPRPSSEFLPGTPRARELGPAWMLPVALVGPDPEAVRAQTVELADAAGLSTDTCVAYTGLAAAVFTHRSTADITSLAGAGAGAALEGDRSLGGPVAATVWALGRPGGVLEVIAALATAPAAARAAAAGVVGLRDGCRAIPSAWRRRLGPAGVVCCRLAAQLVDARTRRTPNRRDDDT